MKHRNTRLLILIGTLWAGILSAHGHAAPQSRLDASLPADAYLIGRMDLNRILASPLGPVVLQDLRTNYDAINWFLGTIFGFDLTAVDSIWFSVDESDSRLVLLQGTYQTERVVDRFSGMPGWTQLNYDLIPVASTFLDQDGNELIAAVIDGNLMALGDRRVMEHMLTDLASRLQQPLPIRTSVQRIIDSPAELAVSVLSTKPLTDIGADFEIVETAWLEGHFNNDLELLLETVGIDERLAQGLEQIAAGLLLIAEQHPQVRADAAYYQAIQAARVQREARIVTTTAVLRRELLEQR